MSSFVHLQNRILEIPNSFDLTQTLQKSKSKSYQNRIPSRCSELILHHSAHLSWNVYDVARYHVVKNGWPAIGYHIVISDRGDIFLCNNLNIQSYHCKGHNFKSIGICCLGNFEEEEMTEKQELALMMVLWTIGTNFHELQVYGHCDVASTLCPGSHFPLQESFDHYREALRYRATEM